MITEQQRVAEQFAKDVREHAIEIIRDNGVDRHVRFKRPGTYCYQFDLVTWPGYLCYSGDMGCYVFTRLNDMFEFFRRPDGSRRIDRGYWAEKCVAVGKHDPIDEFSVEIFDARVRERLEQHIARRDFNTAEVERLRSEVDDEVIGCSDIELDALRAANDFTFNGRHVFPDFFETNCRQYSFRFEWCCQALAWGIAQYDQAKDVAREVA